MEYWWKWTLMRYHLRLIGEIVGYDFPQTSVHEHMGKLYGLPYDEAKAYHLNICTVEYHR